MTASSLWPTKSNHEARIVKTVLTQLNFVDNQNTLHSSMIPKSPRLILSISSLTIRRCQLPKAANLLISVQAKAQPLSTLSTNMQTVKNTLAENFGGKAQGLGSSTFSLDQVPSLEGKVALVTGGDEGIGYGATHTLLSKGISKLFVTSVRQEKGDDALEALGKELGPDIKSKVVYINVDHADWKRTAEVAKEIASQTDRLDIVINNAARGIMTHQIDANGVDLHMSTNHFAHVIMTSHLLPLLKKTAEKGDYVRIVNMTSNLHESAPSDCKFESLEEINKDYGPTTQYARSKLANFLYSKYLDRHVHSAHPKILVNVSYPGIVDTAQTSEHIHEAFPLLGYGMSVLTKPFQKSQFEGCVSCIFASTVTSGSGQYITPPSIVEKGSDKGNDEQLQEQLMKITREIVQAKTKKDSSDKGCPFRDY